jgi:hypothetical protein
MNLLPLLLIWILCGGIVTIFNIFVLGAIKPLAKHAGEELFWISIIIGGPVVWFVTWLARLKPSPVYGRIK